jgi:phosphohistidine swiveling domain-containing protein
MTTAEPTSSAPEAADFPIEWRGDEEALEWEWDDMHTPRAMPPLSEDYLACLEAGFAYGYQAVGHPAVIHVRVWNGYAYFAYQIEAPPEDHAAIRAAAPDRYRAEIALTLAYWERSLEELRLRYAEIDAVTGTEPAAVLVPAWKRAWESARRAWQIHFHAITGPYQVLEDLADRYEALIEGGSAVHALELVAGTVPELHAVDVDLERLAASASSAPAVAERLAAAPAPSLAELERLPGGAPFLAELAAFQVRHGHLGSVLEDLMDPSWSEDAGPLLAEVGRRIGQTPGAAEARRAERAAVAARRAELVRAALVDRPSELAELEALAAKAREISHLTEGHNYWIDRMASDRLRRLAFRVGRRLVADGGIAEPEDVLFLHRVEIEELLAAPRDRRALVKDRRARHERNRAMTPPAKVGTIRPSDPDAKPDRFEGGRFTADEDDTLRGTGASAGVASGTARVVFGPGDFDRVEPGDIVVATASNPGWLPLFAIAGGFVTDTGGVLSHAAVVAREFGVPAVVGTREGTKKIRDGRRIEIDGTTGVVRLA